MHHCYSLCNCSLLPLCPMMSLPKLLQKERKRRYTMCSILSFINYEEEKL